MFISTSSTPNFLPFQGISEDIAFKHRRPLGSEKYSGANPSYQKIESYLSKMG
jgi:hypothetical protein